MNPTAASQSLIHIRDLRISFRRHGAEPFEAVKGIDLDLQPGESMAIVGESGSGKSVTALSFARLLPEPPAKIEAAEFSVAGRDVLKLGGKELRKMRGKDVAYVFQEPSTSLNPVLTVRTQMAEALELHRPEVKNRDEEIVKWLYQVGIVEPEKRLRAYPHELSGGMQQRVMIAMALCCQPKLLIADEPTTALDVTIQKQIIDLLVSLKASLGMSIILITHNFAIIRGIADKVAVMFRGQIVESGPTEEVLGNPQHRYTQALLDCVPRLGVKQSRLRAIDYTALDKIVGVDLTKAS
ncbi:peptide/nickel transport system ATP-binding protein [Roseimicrobium gellanilyticum]|uniref:Peptide/nickel transport system ATP-binding protein n=1 Tax=Roseimicrobium gellanilyticum TaxID=748857 RepID=A0A366HM23_9BACT|nr:ABC transporter ATP-binding protein [Roseimicrobium gellanilyticum]RBP43924.1 peptide/nickel transport system ATP-binding protein [Roseimicrobium gellanilyticum]